MSRRAVTIRGLVVPAALACALAASARPVAAGPVSDAARLQAERAFVLGRLQDLEAIVGAGTTAADAEPLFVRDVVWRPSGARRARPADDGSLSSRRIAWMVEQFAVGRATLSAYPLASDGERDPYPMLTALVLDRARREATGAAGLPDASPLASVRDEVLEWLAKVHARPLYTGVPFAPEGEEAARAEGAAQEVREQLAAAASRARLLALGSVGGLVLAAAGAFLLLGLGRRKRPPPAADH